MFLNIFMWYVFNYMPYMYEYIYIYLFPPSLIHSAPHLFLAGKNSDDAVSSCVDAGGQKARTATMLCRLALMLVAKSYRKKLQSGCMGLLKDGKTSATGHSQS